MAAVPSPLLEVRGRSVSIDGEPLVESRRFAVGIWQVEVSPPVDFSKGSPGARIVIENRGTFYLKRKGTHLYRVREDGQIQKLQTG